MSASRHLNTAEFTKLHKIIRLSVRQKGHKARPSFGKARLVPAKNPGRTSMKKPETKVVTPKG